MLCIIGFQHIPEAYKPKHLLTICRTHNENDRHRQRFQKKKKKKTTGYIIVNQIKAVTVDFKKCDKKAPGLYFNNQDIKCKGVLTWHLLHVYLYTQPSEKNSHDSKNGSINCNLQTLKINIYQFNGLLADQKLAMINQGTSSFHVRVIHSLLINARDVRRERHS